MTWDAPVALVFLNLEPRSDMRHGSGNCSCGLENDMDAAMVLMKAMEQVPALTIVVFLALQFLAHMRESDRAARQLILDVMDRMSVREIANDG